MKHTETDGISRLPPPVPRRTPPLVGTPDLAAKAVEFLCASNSGFGFEVEEAKCVVSYLRSVSYSQGNFLYREGDDTKSGYMLLLLEGEVSVDTSASGRADRVAISVLGPGSLIGEMALIDGSPRSASCIAVSTVVQAAGLSHSGLELLGREHPRVAFKLMVYVARTITDRLRALGEQLHIYDQLIANLHQKVDDLGRAG
jgi:CRP/FNR family transcriptional regulator, cyclic AMP receptor protein